MELHYKTSVFAVQSDGNALLMITIPKEQSNLYDKLQAFEDDKQKVMAIDYVKKIRSLTANAYMWSILSKMAEILLTTDEELYIKYLNEKAPREYIGALKETEEIFKRMYKIVDCVRDCTINETPAVTFKLIRGSSKFDSKEFSVFLDYIIQDARLLGIQTLEDDRINELVERWKPE